MIYLICHSGFLNYGDELIAANWIKFISEKYSQETIYIDTCRPGTSSLLHHSSNKLVFTDTLWRLASYCMDRDMDYVLSLDFLRDAGPDIQLGLEILRRSDIVHLVGGGYITDYHYPNYAILRLVSDLKRKYDFKLFATGLGIEPINVNNGVILRNMLQKFDWVDLRDQDSYLTVTGATSRPNVTCSVDDAFLGSFTSSAPDGRDNKLVIIAQQDEVRDIVLPFLLNLIKNCPFSKNGVIIPVLDKTADLPLAEQVRDLTETPVDIVDHIDLYKRGLPVAPGDFVFSTRFHGHLVSSALGARGLCASVRLPYYDIKHRSLVDLGSGFDLIGMHDFNFERYNWYNIVPSLYNKLQELHERKMDIVDKIYTF